MKQIPTIPSGFQRIFIGIGCDHRVQRQINDVLLPTRKSSLDVRWVPETNRHLTLAFLGNIPASRLESLMDFFDATYRQVEQFQIKLTRLVRFPDTNGRIIALITEPDHALNLLYQATLGLLQSSDLDLERKEFRPHITLGRIRKAEQVKTIFNQPVGIALIISSIRIYQSTLSESGSIYSVLKETP